MKHFLCLLLLSFSVAIEAQTTRRITLEFNKEDFELKKEELASSINSMKHAIVYDTDYDSPALPYVCIIYLVGKDEKYIGNSYSTQSELFGNDVIIASNPKCTSFNSHVETDWLHKSDKTEQHSPQKVHYTGTHYLGEYKYLTFLICPFEYKPKEKLLFLNTKIDIDIELSESNEENIESIAVPKRSALDQITKMVINPEDADVLYQTEFLRNSPSDTLYHYLIVTVDSLKSEYQRLADWKTAKGCRAHIVTIEEINNAYGTDTCFVRIKKMIQNYYNRSNWDLQYVLLGGTTNLLPTLKCYSENVFADHVEYPTDGACDMYYSCLTDIEWDKNHNGVYGELTDTVDLTQYFSVSRLSTQNVYETQNIVNRILKYEQSPDTIGWKNEILLCGNVLDSYTTENNKIVSDSQRKCERIFSDYISPTGWNGTRFRFYDTDTDHPNAENYDVIADNLQNELSKGYSFTHICTHGELSRLLMEDSFYYHTFYVDTLHAPRYTLVMTNACQTNNIEWPSLFLGGAFMNSINAGFIGYYGCSENSITYAGLGPGEYFCGEAWNKLLSGTYHLGDAVRESKNTYFSSVCNGYSNDRWLYLYMNPLCDPELTIYTKTPIPVPHLQIAHRYYDLSISYQMNTKICITSRFDQGNSYYLLYNYMGPHTFSLQPNEYLVTVTYPNSVPYRTIFSNVVYLQNESLENNLNVDAEQVVIGSNVASNRSQGPVTVENGSSAISTRDGTTIHNDFEVKMGASLEITTNTSDLF